jgi:hypothetical protein
MWSLLSITDSLSPITQSITDYREPLINMVAHHWTRAHQLYHVSCFLLTFVYLPSSFLLILSCWLVEASNSCSSPSHSFEAWHSLVISYA